MAHSRHGKKRATRKPMDRKQAARDADAAAVARGEKTWAQVNRENSIASQVIESYTPRKQLGVHQRRKPDGP